MNKNTFNKLVSSRFAHCKATLESKDKEYGSDTDRLHNFVVAGRKLDCSPIKALQGMDIKHEVSLDDIINKMDKDDLYVPSIKMINEKITDKINYLLLAEALMEDRRACLYQPDDIQEVASGPPIMGKPVSPEGPRFGNCHECARPIIGGKCGCDESDYLKGDSWHDKKKAKACPECHQYHGFHGPECSHKKTPDVPESGRLD